MSATLSGLIVLENARPDDDGLPLSVLFDGQMWLGPERILTGTFRYYNSPNYSFPEIGNYFAWIHVAKFTPELPVPSLVVHAQQVPVANGGVAAEPQPGTASERQPSREEQQKDEEVATGSSHGGAGDGPTSSDALGEPASDILHVVGDIVQLIPTKADGMHQQAYINVSGAAVNSNRTDSFFEINPAQYTSYYKSNPLSVLPVRAHFNLNKYRNRKPMPSDNTYVSVDGFLTDVGTDAAGYPTLFHMSIDNISFLGRAGANPPSITGGLGPSTPRSSRFKHVFGASPSPSTSATLCSPEPESPTRATRRITTWS